MYLNEFGPGPELGQENRSAGPDLREICLKSAMSVFLCLARFSASQICKNLRPGCCTVSFFI